MTSTIIAAVSKAFIKNTDNFIIKEVVIRCAWQFLQKLLKLIKILLK